MDLYLIGFILCASVIPGSICSEQISSQIQLEEQNCPLVARSSPKCFTDFNQSIFSRICKTKNVVKVLLLKPSSTDLEQCGMLRVTENYTDIAETNFKTSLKFSLSEDATAECQDLLTKQSGQVFIIMEGLKWNLDEGLSLDDGATILLYNQGNERKIKDAIERCSMTSEETDQDDDVDIMQNDYPNLKSTKQYYEELIHPNHPPQPFRFPQPRSPYTYKQPITRPHIRPSPLIYGSPVTYHQPSRLGSVQYSSPQTTYPIYNYPSPLNDSFTPLSTYPVPQNLRYTYPYPEKYTAPQIPSASARYQLPSNYSPPYRYSVVKQPLWYPLTTNYTTPNYTATYRETPPVYQPAPYSVGRSPIQYPVPTNYTTPIYRETPPVYQPTPYSVGWPPIQYPVPINYSTPIYRETPPVYQPAPYSVGRPPIWYPVPANYTSPNYTATYRETPPVYQRAPYSIGRPPIQYPVPINYTTPIYRETPPVYQPTPYSVGRPPIQYPVPINYSTPIYRETPPVYQPAPYYIGRPPIWYPVPANYTSPNYTATYRETPPVYQRAPYSIGRPPIQYPVPINYTTPIYRETPPVYQPAPYSIGRPPIQYPVPINYTTPIYRETSPVYQPAPYFVGRPPIQYPVPINYTTPIYRENPLPVYQPTPFYVSRPPIQNQVPTNYTTSNYTASYRDTPSVANYPVYQSAQYPAPHHIPQYHQPAPVYHPAQPYAFPQFPYQPSIQPISQYHSQAYNVNTSYPRGGTYFSAPFVAENYIPTTIPRSPTLLTHSLPYTVPERTCGVPPLHCPSCHDKLDDIGDRKTCSYDYVLSVDFQSGQQAMQDNHCHVMEVFKVLAGESRYISPILYFSRSHQCQCGFLQNFVGPAILLIPKTALKEENGIYVEINMAKIKVLRYAFHNLVAINKDLPTCKEQYHPISQIDDSAVAHATYADCESSDLTCTQCYQDFPELSKERFCKAKFAIIFAYGLDLHNQQDVDSIGEKYERPKVTLESPNDYGIQNFNIIVSGKNDIPLNYQQENKPTSACVHYHVKGLFDVEPASATKSIAVNYTLHTPNVCSCPVLERGPGYGLLLSDDKLSPLGGQEIHLTSRMAVYGLPYGPAKIPNCENTPIVESPQQYEVSIAPPPLPLNNLQSVSEAGVACPASLGNSCPNCFAALTSQIDEFFCSAKFAGVVYVQGNGQFYKVASDDTKDEYKYYPKIIVQDDPYQTSRIVKVDTSITQHDEDIVRTKRGTYKGQCRRGTLYIEQDVTPFRQYSPIHGPITYVIQKGCSCPYLEYPIGYALLVSPNRPLQSSQNGTDYLWGSDVYLIPLRHGKTSLPSCKKSHSHYHHVPQQPPQGYKPDYQQYGPYRHVLHKRGLEKTHHDHYHEDHHHHHHDANVYQTNATAPYSSSYSPPANYSYGNPPPANYSYGYSPPANYSYGYSPPANYSYEYSPPANYSYGYSPPANYSYGYSPPANYSYGYSPPANYSYGYSPPANYSYGYSPPANYSYGYSPPANYSYGYSPPANYSYGYSPPANYSYGYGPPVNVPYSAPITYGAPLVYPKPASYSAKQNQHYEVPLPSINYPLPNNSQPQPYYYGPHNPIYGPSIYESYGPSIYESYGPPLPQAYGHVHEYAPLNYSLPASYNYSQPEPYKVGYSTKTGRISAPYEVPLYNYTVPEPVYYAPAKPIYYPPLQPLLNYTVPSPILYTPPKPVYYPLSQPVVYSPPPQPVIYSQPPQPVVYSPQPQPNYYPAPKPQPIYYPKPQPVYYPKPQPVYYPKPQPVYYPKPQPVYYPKPQPVYYPKPQPVYYPKPQPVYYPKPQPVYYPKPQPVYYPKPQPVYYPKPQPVYYPKPQPVYYPKPQPVFYPKPQPVFYPKPQPVYYPKPQPVYYPKPQPVYYPKPQPVYYPQPQPVYYPAPLAHSPVYPVEKEETYPRHATGTKYKREIHGYEPGNYLNSGKVGYNRKRTYVEPSENYKPLNYNITMQRYSQVPVSPQPGPVAYPQPGPVAYHQPRPVAYHQPRPVAYPQPGPVAYPQPGPVAYPQPRPVAYPQPGPVAYPQPGPVAYPQPGPIAYPQSGPVAYPQPGPVSYPQPGPVAYQQPRPIPYQQPRPIPYQQPRPIPYQQPQPIPYQQPRPIPYHQPRPVAYHQPRPVAYHQPRPVAYPQPETLEYSQFRPVMHPHAVSKSLVHAQTVPASYPQPIPVLVYPQQKLNVQCEHRPVNYYQVSHTYPHHRSDVHIQPRLETFQQPQPRLTHRQSDYVTPHYTSNQLQGLNCPFGRPKSCPKLYKSLDYDLKSKLCTFDYILLLEILKISDVLEEKENYNVLSHQCGTAKVPIAHKGFTRNFAKTLYFTNLHGCYNEFLQSKSYYFIFANAPNMVKSQIGEIIGVHLEQDIHILRYNPSLGLEINAVLNNCLPQQPLPINRYLTADGKKSDFYECPQKNECPKCLPKTPFAYEDLYCSSQYAAVVALGLDYTLSDTQGSNLVFKASRDNIHSIQYKTSPNVYASINVPISSFDTDGGDLEYHKCYRDTLRILYDVSYNKAATVLNKDIHTYIPSKCDCSFLKADPGYYLILSQKPILDPSYNLIQLGRGFVTLPLPVGTLTLPRCRSDFQREKIGQYVPPKEQYIFHNPVASIPRESSPLAILPKAAPLRECLGYTNASCAHCLPHFTKDLEYEYCQADYVYTFKLLEDTQGGYYSPLRSPVMSILSSPQYTKLKIHGAYQHPIGSHDFEHNHRHKRNTYQAGNSCPSGFIYSECAPAPGCEPTCDSHYNIHCYQRSCHKGCKCPEGLVRKENHCIRPQDCVQHSHREQCFSGKIQVMDNLKDRVTSDKIVNFYSGSFCSCQYLEYPIGSALIFSRKTPLESHTQLTDDFHIISLPRGQTDLPICPNSHHHIHHPHPLQSQFHPHPHPSFPNPIPNQIPTCSLAKPINCYQCFNESFLPNICHYKDAVKIKVLKPPTITECGEVQLLEMYTDSKHIPFQFQITAMDNCCGLIIPGQHLILLNPNTKWDSTNSFVTGIALDEDVAILKHSYNAASLILHQKINCESGISTFKPYAPNPQVTETIPHITETIPKVTETIPPVTEPTPQVTETIPPVTQPTPQVTETIPPVTEPTNSEECAAHNGHCPTCSSTLSRVSEDICKYEYIFKGEISKIPNESSKWTRTTESSCGLSTIDEFYLGDTNDFPNNKQIGFTMDPRCKCRQLKIGYQVIIATMRDHWGEKMGKLYEIMISEQVVILDIKNEDEIKDRLAQC